MNVFTKVGSRVAGVLALVGSLVYAPAAFAAPSTQGIPDQSGCDNGSVSLTWNSMGIVRPVIAVLSVDGEVVADPINPTIGSLGATICPGTTLGNRTGLSVYRKVDATTNDLDLTGAVTPITRTPLTADSQITITMTNMGDLARHFTFALVHGQVSNWTTSNLGTTSASVSVTMKPTRTPYGSGTDFGGCTATPPNCLANKSDSDALSVSLDMTFDQSGGSANLRGSYFALTGAMGGYVQAQQASDGSRSLVASLGGPHYLADGSTLNVGNMQAFLPTATVQELLGITGSLSASDLALTRTESGSSTSASFTLTSVSGGVLLSVPDIGFSSPAYTIKKAAAVATPTPVPGLPNTGGAPRSENTAALVLSALMLVGAGFALKKNAAR